MSYWITIFESDYADGKKTNVKNWEKLGEAITSWDWAAATFIKNHRSVKNFKSLKLLVLDIDEGCSIDNAVNLFMDTLSKSEHIASASLVGTKKNKEISDLVYYTIKCTPAKKKENNKC